MLRNGGIPLFAVRSRTAREANFRSTSSTHLAVRNERDISTRASHGLNCSVGVFTDSEAYKRQKMYEMYR
jgi:hypothetical protein